MKTKERKFTIVISRFASGLRYLVGPTTFVPAVSVFFSPYTKLNSERKEVTPFNFETGWLTCCFVVKILSHSSILRFFAALIVW